jgi:fatty acid desaturase
VKPERAGERDLRACRTCFYWRVGLMAAAAALLATWLAQRILG